MISKRGVVGAGGAVGSAAVGSAAVGSAAVGSAAVLPKSMDMTYAGIDMAYIPRNT